MKDIGSLLAGDDEVAVAPVKRGLRSAPTTRAKQAIMQAPEAKTWRIRLEENDNIPPTGQFFSLNGKTFQLRPGEDCDVPEGIVSILNDAIMSVANIDPVTMQVNGYRDRLRFPYQVVSRVV